MTWHRRSLWPKGTCGVCNLCMQHCGRFLLHVLYAVNQRLILPCGYDNCGDCNEEFGVNSLFHAERWGSWQICFHALLLYKYACSINVVFYGVAPVFAEFEIMFCVMLHQSFEFLIMYVWLYVLNPLVLCIIMLLSFLFFHLDRLSKPSNSFHGNDLLQQIDIL